MGSFRRAPEGARVRGLQTPGFIVAPSPGRKNGARRRKMTWQVRRVVRSPLPLPVHPRPSLARIIGRASGTRVHRGHGPGRLAPQRNPMRPIIDEPGPVRPGEEVDADRLSAYLDEHGEGFEGPVAVCQFLHGHSNLTYLLRDGS